MSSSTRCSRTSATRSGRKRTGREHAGSVRLHALLPFRRSAARRLAVPANRLVACPTETKLALIRTTYHATLLAHVRTEANFGSTAPGQRAPFVSDRYARHLLRRQPRSIA